MRSAALVVLTALTALFLAPAEARADVIVSPSALPVAEVGLRFTVGVESKHPDKPVNKVDLVFPNSLDVTRVFPPEGWSVDKVDATTFTVAGPARTGRIAAEVWLGKTPSFPANLPIIVVQWHTDGLAVRWIEFPTGDYKAGALAVTAAAVSPAASTAPAAATTTPADTREESDDSALPWAVGGATAVLVLLAAALLVVRSRRRRDQPPGASAAPAHDTDPPPGGSPDAPSAAPGAATPQTATQGSTHRTATPFAAAPATATAPTATASMTVAPEPVAGAPATTGAATIPGSVRAEPAAPAATGTAPAPHLAAPVEPPSELATTVVRPPAEAGDGGQVRLAIDYGTSNTVALLRWPDGRVRPLLFDASPLLPSAVQDIAGRLVAGRDALNAARTDPAAHEQNPKRRITDLSVLLGEREHDVADLIAATLRRVADEAQRVTGAAVPGGVVLTHPAAWGTIRREILVDAAARAGLSDPVLVAEPVAAAAYFAEVLGHELVAGQCVVIFDLGAGTFDVTVVKKHAGEDLDILAADGLDDLGGLDFDALVVSMIGAQAGARAEGWEQLLHPRTPAERRFARLLWDDARGAKEALSRLSTATVSVPSLDFDAHLTREQFEVAARPLLTRTVRATAAVLRAARVPDDAVAGLFLVGGSTRIPLVATLLFQELHIRPIVLEQPETVVAEGALRHAQRVTT
jgi:hypothetical protein